MKQFKNLKEYNDALIMHQGTSKIYLTKLEDFTKDVHRNQYDSADLVEVKFHLDQAYTAAKAHNKRMAERLDMMKTEDYKRLNIEGYAI